MRFEFNELIGGDDYHSDQQLTLSDLRPMIIIICQAL